MFQIYFFNKKHDLFIHYLHHLECTSSWSLLFWSITVCENATNNGNGHKIAQCATIIAGLRCTKVLSVVSLAVSAIPINRIALFLLCRTAKRLDEM